jgi:hypothetical protein
MSPARVLALFAFYAAALELGAGSGLVAAVASPVGLLLLAAAGALLAWRTAREARRGGVPPARRAARLLVGGGGALALLALPASLVARDTRQLTVGEGQTVEAGRLPGLSETRFGAVSLAPRGPHVLSKTVAIEAAPLEGEPVSIGLFPPAAIGRWRATVFRYGYAAGVTWLGEGGAEVVQAYVMLGTLPHSEQDAALVVWTPEPNVMMGAGTFPPRLEELVSPPGADRHLFLRIDEATIAGARRDLRDPDAYRWLVDGRLVDPVFFAQVFRGREKVFEGKVRGGEAVRFPGGALELDREVLLWVDLLAVRDPFLAWAGAGLVALALGLLLRGALAVGRLAARGAAPG